MQYGAMIPNLGAAVDPEEISAMTRQVENAGYDTLMVSDHVILPTSPRVTVPVQLQRNTHLQRRARHPRAVHPAVLPSGHHPASAVGD